ncbi:urease subunit alpha [Klebsiella pneumoniae]|uniref:Urease subunit alpha n=1 Tax=Klebsiella pneumoniae TaxID=573 RepID=A0A378FSG2_KLEPN|nr:urease subunit alpha [Klebsiella pneumoniae]
MLAADCVDLVLTNALIVDHWGIVKADIGREGRPESSPSAKPVTPDIQPNVTIPHRRCDGSDCRRRKNCHRRRDRYPYSTGICPQQAEEALVSGVTHHGRRRHRPGRGHPCHHLHPGPVVYLHACCRRPTSLPVNIGLLGKGNVSQPDALREQVAAGVIGLKIHEDWGATPAAIDCALNRRR